MLRRNYPEEESAKPKCLGDNIRDRKWEEIAQWSR
jgi:hypothetical protein